MVQRKVPNRLGLQSVDNLKPTSSQNQDGKTRGSDMKKKMKKSRPIKVLSNIPLKETINPQPEKLSTPQKPPMIKSSSTSPNYMKGTSSSEARKERPQMSSLNRRNSAGSDSAQNRNRSFSKSSSLKLVRTLTKSPSFKPAKKCSRVATCSSTLKDLKFPPYLMLNPGGTESDGTSVLKVCPYSYCSLNGHHHTPLPPLKCFLKAKRRSLKTQKSLKMEAMSPRKVKLSGNGTEALGMDFFVEIYSKNQEHEDNKDRVSYDLEQQKTESSLEEEEGNASDMDWEEGEVLNSEIDAKVEKEINLSDKPEIIASDDTVSNCTEEILADDVLQELFDEETASCSTQCYDSEMDSEVDNDLAHGQASSIEEALVYMEEKSDGVITMEESILGSEVANGECGTINEAWKCDQEDESPQFDSGIDLLQGQAVDSCESSDDTGNVETNECQKPKGAEADESFYEPTEDDVHGGENKFKIQTSKDSEEQDDSNISKLRSVGDKTGAENTKMDVETKSEIEENSVATNKETNSRSGSKYLGKESDLSQEPEEVSSNRKWTIECKKTITDSEEEREFNPKGPNFLPVVPDPEVEKVDLKHQDMDDRKNAEEWMIDYALQQAVTKLAPARKRKVALLVEAFETVLPIPKHSNNIRHTTSAFAHSRPIQACS